MTRQQDSSIDSAFTRVDDWATGWRDCGAIALLLDFDGTLAPIVARPEHARLSPEARASVQALAVAAGAYVAIVSGRGLADVRSRVEIDGIAYAGNHGMEIEGPGVHRLHPEATEARPLLEQVIERATPALASIHGAILEDKGLTLTIHYREVARALVPQVREVVERSVSDLDGLSVTEGKEVLEIRPQVDWHKGKAVEFLLREFRGGANAPVIYIGDDTTDEDAFEAVQKRIGGTGVIVGSPATTVATARVDSVADVERLLELLLARVPGKATGHG